MHRGNDTVDLGRYEHDASKSLFVPAHVNVSGVRDLRCPLNEPVSASLRNAQL